MDKTLEGPDHKASLDPLELKDMCQHIRNLELIFGNGIKTPTETEILNRLPARKSLIYSGNLKEGHTIKMEDFDARRPSNGMDPKDCLDLIGKKLSKNVKMNERVERSHF